MKTKQIYQIDKLKKDNCYDCGSENYCVCNGLNCTDQMVFTFPSTTNDSFGMCKCKDSKDSESFNCSVNPNSHLTLYIALLLTGTIVFILILTFIALIIAIVIVKRVLEKRRIDKEYEQVSG